MASKRPVSPAVDDLGLGDQLKQQTETADQIRKKKKLMAAANTGNTQDMVGSPAAAMLYGKVML